MSGSFSSCDKIHTVFMLAYFSQSTEAHSLAGGGGAGLPSRWWAPNPGRARRRLKGFIWNPVQELEELDTSPWEHEHEQAERVGKMGFWCTISLPRCTYKARNNIAIPEQRLTWFVLWWSLRSLPTWTIPWFIVCVLGRFACSHWDSRSSSAHQYHCVHSFFREIDSNGKYSEGSEKCPCFILGGWSWCH